MTLCVHAGIAASDAICCARLSQHVQGEDHTEAVRLLAKVDPALGRHLSTLLGVKTKAGYSHRPASAAECKRAARAAEALLKAARSL